MSKMLNAQEVCDRLKVIGPFVAHKETVFAKANKDFPNENLVQSFHVKDVETGMPRHTACLGVPGVSSQEVITEENLQAVMEEGRKRYSVEVVS